ncbi:MAG: amidohydrolase [Candidatus Aminicenantes bacterium]
MNNAETKNTKNSAPEKPDITIAWIQTALHWEDPSANLEMFGRKLKAVSGDADLIVLPEMFNTGFSMDAEKWAEGMDGPSVSWLRGAAAEKGCVITASLIIRDRGRYFNRLIWMRPDGSYVHYDKRHLFRMAGEHLRFSPGNQRVLAELKGWRIRPLICYDLRFPVWSRSLGDTDVLIFTANWPQPRRLAWNILLPARAVENQCCVVGVNRVGKDGNGIPYSGDSAAYNAKGEAVHLSRPHAESIGTAVLSWSALHKFRREFQAELDADRFEVL